MEVNQLIRSIAPSATMAITAKAKAMKRAGEDVVSFGAGEPDFDTPAFIADAAIEAIRNGETRYTAGQGTPDLRQAVADRWQADYGLSYSADQIVVSTGAKQSIYNLLVTAIEPGDEVVIPAPFWVSYPDMVKLAGGTPKTVFCGADQGFCLQPDQLREAIGPKTKGLILNNPSNPTGGAYTKEALAALAEVAVESGLWVVSDEIYDKLIFGDHSHTPFASISDDAFAITATVNGVSKAYAMTGWRIGYAGRSGKLAQIVRQVARTVYF